MFLRTCIAAALLALICRAEAVQVIPIGSISFEGNREISSAKLKMQLRLNREGGAYQPEILKHELRALQSFCRDEGYLQASIGTPVVDLLGQGNGRTAAIRIPVVEGPLFRTGEVEVKNVRAFRVASLLQMSPLRKGEPYSRRRLADWRQKIVEGYQSMGYLRLDINLKEQLHEHSNTVDVTLDVKEGNPYRVSKITVVGDVNPSEFKRRLLAGEGGLYNPEMISLSLQFINQLGLYAPLSQSDIEIKYDDERSAVELVFRVSAAKTRSSKL
jgi:outer membrane protein insertion porin family